jgi:hypothetical protein
VDREIGGFDILFADAESAHGRNDIGKLAAQAVERCFRRTLRSRLQTDQNFRNFRFHLHFAPPLNRNFSPYL